MSVIQMSQQTTLRGAALRAAVDRTVQELTTNRTYANAATFELSWAGNRLNIVGRGRMTGGVLMSGYADIQDGSPLSTITLRLDLDSSVAIMRRSAERDLLAAAQRNLPRGGSSATPTHPAPPAPTGDAVATPGNTPQPAAPAEESWLERRRRERAERQASGGESWLERRRRERAERQAAGGGSSFDWGSFGSAMTGLFSGASSVFDQYSLVGQQAGAEAVAIAKEASPIGPNTGVQTGPGFILGQGKAVAPDAPLPGGRPPSDVPPDEGVTDPEDVGGMPSWGWWAIGIGGVAAVGAVGLMLFRKRDDEEDFRETIGYDDTISSDESERAVALHKAGFSIPEISASMGISRGMAKRYLDQGSDFEPNADPARVRAYQKLRRRGRGPKKRKHAAFKRSDLYREAAAMRAAGFSISEISSALGVSRNMVKSYLAKGRLSA